MDTKNFSPKEFMKKLLLEHISNMNNFYCSSRGYEDAKIKWDKLKRKEIMAFTIETILKEMKKSLINKKHYYQVNKFKDIYVIVSTIPQSNPDEAKKYFKNGYIAFLEQFFKDSNYNSGAIDFVHWIICSDGRLQNTHLTYIVALNRVS